MRAAIVAMLMMGLPSVAAALSCAPFDATAVAKDDKAIVIVGEVLRVTSIPSTQAHHAPHHQYQVKVRQSWKDAPKVDELITVTGTSLGEWPAPEMKQSVHGYLMILQSKNGAYQFGPCSTIFDYQPIYDDIIELDRLLRLSAAAGDDAAGSTD